MRRRPLTIARCDDCGREQTIRGDGAGFVVLDAGEILDDEEASDFLLSIGWALKPADYIPHDWSGVAGRAKLRCPFCVARMSRGVPS